MTTNIGKIIKVISIIFFVLCVLASIIVGAIFISEDGIGIIIIFGGLVFSFISYAFLYGYGDLIETNYEMANMMRAYLTSRNTNPNNQFPNNMNTPPYHAPQQTNYAYQAPMSNNAPHQQTAPNTANYRASAPYGAMQNQQAPNTTPNRQPSPGATAPYNQQAYMAEQEARRKEQEARQREFEERQREESIRINRFERERTQQENEMLSANAIEVKVSHGEVICPTCGNTIECGPVRKPIVCKKCQTAIKPVTNISSTPVQEENYTVAQESIPNEASQRIDREERQRSQQANAQIAQNAVEVKITFGEIVCPSCGDTTESGPILKPFVCKKCKTAIKPIK